MAPGILGGLTQAEQCVQQTRHEPPVRQPVNSQTPNPSPHPLDGDTMLMDSKGNVKTTKQNKRGLQLKMLAKDNFSRPLRSGVGSAKHCGQVLRPKYKYLELVDLLNLSIRIAGLKICPYHCDNPNTSPQNPNHLQRAHIKP